jgi:hypothetical protein
MGDLLPHSLRRTAGSGTKETICKKNKWDKVWRKETLHAVCARQGTSIVHTFFPLLLSLSPSVIFHEYYFHYNLLIS